MKKLELLFILLLLCSVSFAQTRQLNGTVRDSSGGLLASATVKVDGKNTTAITGADGSFSLVLPLGSARLQVSSVGYAAQDVNIDANDNNVIIQLGKSTAQLQEVVVTALGISKESRKIGYAVTTVSGDALNRARETNVALSLEGRVAGLNVKGTSSGPGGTAKILLRGMPSMNGAGSPLFVINGVPMDNTQRGSAGEWGGSDNGDGIGNINPDDIETMTVLKGQSASALYGARASNGVILITTKSGKKGSYSVDYNSNFMVEKAMDLTDFQDQYGQGTGGAKPVTADAAQATSRLSWGAKLDGSQVIQYDGKMYAYSPFKDNVKNFYRSGASFTNTVALTKGGDNGSFRLSLSNLDNDAIIRNSGLNRKTVNLTFDQKITSRLTLNLMANYIDELAKNRAALGDAPMNANNGIYLAPNIDEKILSPGYDPVTGYETRFGDDEYVTNPYFVVNQYRNDVGRKRIINSTSLRYNVLDWLYVQGRLGYDQSNDRTFKVEPWGTAYTTERRGNLQELAQSQRSELNLDGLIGANKKLTTDINLDVAVGGNIRKNKYERVRVAGSQFLIPYLYTLSNVRIVNTNPGDNYQYEERRVNSAYYTVDLGYKNFLTLNTTGRYDAYSTLPISNNKIFTPSVSASLVYSELLNIPNLNFGKLRLSYANTSGELSQAYKTLLYYSLGSPLNGIPVGTFSTDLPSGLLKPFLLTEYEIGTEARFLNNRLGIDVSLYTRKTKNEIMPATFSAAAGFTSGFVGTGSTKNTGVELQITGTPMKGRNFNWNITGNVTSVKNVILETDPAGKNQTLGTYRAVPGSAVTAYVKGYSGPQILAYDYKRDAKGAMVVNSSGVPIRGDLIKMGSVLPKLYGGLNNEFSYKAFTLGFLIDYNFGNKILSGTEAYSIQRGLNKMTLVGRDGITTGVTENGAANTVTASAQSYYLAVAQQITSTSVVSGDFIKFRQFTLGYTVPEAAFANVPLIRTVQLLLVGRNLFFLKRESKNIDPEASFGSTINYAGIEGGNLPSTRTFGINANIKFKN